MIRIAICDDEQNVREMLLRYFSRLSSQNFHLDTFSSAEELISSKISYDILLIDVQMNGMDGISAAKHLRARGCTSLIIFITNYIQYAIDGYEVQAFHFLKKPVEFDRFNSVLCGALALASRRTSASITISGYDQRVNLPISKITYCETDHGRVVVHTSDHAIRCTHSMAQIETLLQGQDFFRIHTAYLVNLAFVEKLLPADVQLADGTILPVSKHRKREFRETLAFFWGGNF